MNATTILNHAALAGHPGPLLMSGTILSRSIEGVEVQVTTPGAEAIQIFRPEWLYPDPQEAMSHAVRLLTAKRRRVDLDHYLGRLLVERLHASLPQN